MRVNPILQFSKSKRPSSFRILDKGLSKIDLGLTRGSLEDLSRVFGSVRKILGFGSRAVVFAYPGRPGRVLKFTLDESDAQTFAKIAALKKSGHILLGAPLDPVVYRYDYDTESECGEIFIIAMERLNPLVSVVPVRLAGVARRFRVYDAIDTAFQKHCAIELESIVEDENFIVPDEDLRRAREGFVAEIQELAEFSHHADEARYLNSVVAAIGEQDRYDIRPLDLHPRNWGIRRYDGAAVFFDFGFSEEKNWTGPERATLFELRAEE